MFSDEHLSDKLSRTGSVHDLACLIKLLTASESDGTTVDVLQGISGLWATFIRPLFLIGLLATSGSEGPVFPSLCLELGLDSILRLL